MRGCLLVVLNRSVFSISCVFKAFAGQIVFRAINRLRGGASAALLFRVIPHLKNDVPGYGESIRFKSAIKSPGASATYYFTP